MDNNVYELQYQELARKGDLIFTPSLSLRSFIQNELMSLPAINWKGVSKILEIGCGGGSQFEKTSFNGELVCLDISPTAIEFARKNGPEKASFIVGNIAAKNFLDEWKGGTFDLIFDAHCLHCITSSEERDRYFHNISHLLNEGALWASETMVSHTSMGFDDHYVFKDNILTKDDQNLRYIPGCRDLEHEILGHGLNIVYLRAYESLKMIPDHTREVPLPTDPEVMRVVAKK